MIKKRGNKRKKEQGKKMTSRHQLLMKTSYCIIVIFLISHGYGGKKKSVNIRGNQLFLGGLT